MKNPRARAPKKSAQASRTVTRLSAMNNISRGPDRLTLNNSELGANEIEELKQKFSDGELFELPDSDIASPSDVPESEVMADTAYPSKLKDIIADEGSTSASQSSGLEKASQNVDNKKVENGKEDDTQQSTAEKPQTRLPLPPRPFTIISGFRK